MKRCCICNQEIQDENASIFCIGSDGEERPLCAQCEKHTQNLFDGTDEEQQNEEANYFAAYLPKIQDGEVKAVLLNQLNSAGYKTQKQIQAEARENDLAAKSWISHVRTFVSIGIILGILASIAVGILLIRDISVFLGLVVMALGALFSFLFSAVIIIFLNMAEDINRIKAFLEKE